MSTFQELQKRLTDASNRLTIVQYLIDHLDSDFRSNAGVDPKNFLLTPTKSAVPQEAIESMVSQILLPISQELEQEMQTVLNTNIAAPVSPVVPVADPVTTEAPTPPVAEVKPKRKYTKRQPKVANEDSKNE
jgi:hypothetical protein